MCDGKIRQKVAEETQTKKETLINDNKTIACQSTIILQTQTLLCWKNRCPNGAKCDEIEKY